MKFTSLFSGFGLVDIGAKAAGFELVAANEINPKIADVYRMNHGDHIRVGDILDQDPQDYPDTDLLHASPVCTNASNANVNGEESKLDIATAEKVAEFIRAKKPRFFTLENVSGYRKFESFGRIVGALDNLGYFYDVSILNSADFGVPQTRRRLFVRAVKGGLVPNLPAPVKWVGWYEAVADIVDTFPDTEFAPWQVARLPKEEMEFIFNENRSSFAWAQESDVIPADNPYATVRAGGRLPRAFLMRSREYGGQTRGEPYRYEDQPASSVMASHGLPKAFVVSGGSGNFPKRAVVNGTPNDYGKTVTYRGEDEPMFTVTASEPRRPARAWLEDGRVVRITPRGLARFQSVPDDFILPDLQTLACDGIGNGVPSLMYQRIAEAFR